MREPCLFYLVKRRHERRDRQAEHFGIRHPPPLDERGGANLADLVRAATEMSDLGLHSASIS